MPRAEFKTKSKGGRQSRARRTAKRASLIEASLKCVNSQTALVIARAIEEPFEPKKLQPEIQSSIVIPPTHVALSGWFWLPTPYLTPSPCLYFENTANTTYLQSHSDPRLDGHFLKSKFFPVFENVKIPSGGNVQLSMQ